MHWAAELPRRASLILVCCGNCLPYAALAAGPFYTRVLHAKGMRPAKRRI